MTSAYSTDLKLELMVTGENSGTWGNKTNKNLELVQQAIAGYEAVALSDGGTVTLAMTQEALSNARNMVLKFTGTLTTASTVTIPDGIEKFYIFDLSAVTGVTNLTIKTVSGTGFTAGEAAIVAAYSDGTNLNEIALNTLGGTIATAQIDDDAITSAKISANQVVTAKIADNAITTAKISALQVTREKIADDAVGPDQLSNTTVSAGSYTAASITVDAQGRLTAASSGAAGDSNIFPVWFSVNGTYTANPAANKIYVYAAGGGGGASGPGPGQSAGGYGGIGLAVIPVSAPYSVPVVVGTGGPGNPSPNASGTAGNPTTFNTNTIVASAGGAGPGIANGNTNPGPNGTFTVASPATLVKDYTPLQNNVGFQLFPGAEGYRSKGGGAGDPAPGTDGQDGGLVIYENNQG